MPAVSIHSTEAAASPVVFHISITSYLIIYDFIFHGGLGRWEHLSSSADSGFRTNLFFAEEGGFNPADEKRHAQRNTDIQVWRWWGASDSKDEEEEDKKEEEGDSNPV